MWTPKKIVPTSQTAISVGKCLAKTFQTKNGNLPGYTVSSHCQIVGHVARELIYRMPKWLKGEFFPEGSELIAAAHDLGKVSPTFQEKILRGTENYVWNSLPGLENVDPELEKSWGYHAGVSQAAAEGVGKYIPEILGSHHGKTPNHSKLANDEVFGGELWQKERLKLIDVLKKSLNCNWPKVKNEEQALLLAGLTTVSDWIGSSSFFEDPQAKTSWIHRIAESLDAAGFVRPKIRQGMSFEDVFQNFTPREIQTKLIGCITGPGVYIMEAPMGIGKTEAALYAAYKMLADDKATGIYFALPTQLTSDKIHDRVNIFLTKILQEEDVHKNSLLLHGSAWLRETEIGEEGRPGRSWFSTTKRGILAPFAVGTIDQALMSVMNVKHGFVRAFGLAGKVVILDEVHTYDVYTGTIMNKLVQTLHKLNCTVIILSATLTKSRSREFLDAKNEELQSDRYPLISANPNYGTPYQAEVGDFKNKEFSIHFCAEDTKAVEEALRRAEKGQQVLWIENTVKEAQDRFQNLAARMREMNLECGLLHSRFLKSDRNLIEKQWVDLFGLQGKSQRQKGRILVGTQVLEQSLDIDADFLITKICPTDMLFQRIGRLWRHESINLLRPESARREAWILSPSLESVLKHPKKSLGATANYRKQKGVYSLYVLCRTLEVWQNLKSVKIPGQIRPLLEQTYAERQESETYAPYKHELDKARERLERLALVSLSKGGTTQSDINPSTRYSDQTSVDVLLIRKFFKNDSSHIIHFLNEEQMSLDENLKINSKKKWRECSLTLVKNTVSVPIYMAPHAVPKKHIQWLKDYVYLGNEEDDSCFRIAMVNADGTLKGLSGEEVGGNYSLSYDSEAGYQAKKSNTKYSEDDDGW